MNKKIYIKAYLNENFGDDLFIHILTRRYADYEFDLLIDLDYKANLDSNVKYLLDKRGIKSLEDIKNPICRKIVHILNSIKRRKIQIQAINQADYNFYIIGSGFIEQRKKNILKNIEKRIFFSKSPYLIGCNFGPYYTQQYKSKHEKLFQMAQDVCFRDSYSYKLFESLENTRYEKDIVFTYDLGENLTEANKLGKYVAISVVNLDKDGINSMKSRNYIEFVAKIAGIFIDRGLNVALVGFCKNQGDDRISNDIANLISNKTRIYMFNYPEIDYLNLMGIFKNAIAVVAGRYHAAIIGLLYRRKTYILAYSRKVTCVMEDIDLDIKCADINDIDKINPLDFIDNYGYTISESLLKEVVSSADKQFLMTDRILR